MASNYIKILEAQAQQKFEQLTQAQQRAIIEAYNSAGKELVRQYRNTKGPATKALYASYTKKIAEETQQIIEQYAIKGAQVAPSVEKLIMQQAFQMAGLDTSVANDKFENLIGKLGMESVKNVIGGKIYKDGAGLSARVWQASAMSSNKIQEVIAAGLAQNMGAAKLSKLLQDYVNPTARKNWDNKKIKSLLGDGYSSWNKNLEYNALRLARTTLAHTATMSMRQAKKVNPYATKIKWHSVHAAGRTCSICEEMDGQVFETEKCPFDHPNGMCYQTHEMEKSLDEIADELAGWCNGEENERLDNWWKSIGGKDEDKPMFGIINILGSEFKTQDLLKQAADDSDSVYDMLSNVILEEKLEACLNKFDEFDMNKLQRLLGEYSKPIKLNPSKASGFTKSASKSVTNSASASRTTTTSKYVKKTDAVYPGQQKQISEFLNSQSGWRKQGLDLLGDVKIKDSGKGGGCYHPGEKTVYIQKKVNLALRKDNPYRQLLHETGHAVDHHLGLFSESKEFSEAMKKDLENLLARKDSVVSEIKKLPGTQAQGVQDMLSSVKVFSINKEGFYISHSDEYWASQSTKQNRELFAHIYEASANPGQEEVMMKYFPNSFKAVINKLGGE